LTPELAGPVRPARNGVRPPSAAGNVRPTTTAEDAFSMDPQSLKYAQSHEWVFVEGDVATVGISAFAVRQLTDLVYIDLPSVGKKVQAGDTFGEVESVKAVSDTWRCCRATPTARDG